MNDDDRVYVKVGPGSVWCSKMYCEWYAEGYEEAELMRQYMEHVHEAHVSRRVDE